MSSVESHGSSLAVMNEPETELAKGDGMNRCSGLDGAGGVFSGVGGLCLDAEGVRGIGVVVPLPIRPNFLELAGGDGGRESGEGEDG
jgi:hypothetical protein